MQYNVLQPGVVLQGSSFRYVIEKVLGQGSFGITYKAKAFTKANTAFGSVEVEASAPVAIKEFYMKEINTRDSNGKVQGLTQGGLAYNYAEKFSKEAERLSKMKHDSIVKVSDFVRDNNTYYYVMEYIEGEDLNRYVAKHPMNEAEALASIIEVAKALLYMHSQHRMLHLDVKPGNIMRRKDGHVVLIDFGLSKHYNEAGIPDTSTTVGLGTPGYAPIEQGKKTTSNNLFLPTIDVYALGATLFKLLTSETPPEASDVLADEDLLPDIMTKHAVSAKVQEVVIASMMPKAKDRYPDMQVLINMLSPYVNVNRTTPAEDTIVVVEEVPGYNLKNTHEFVDLGLSVKWATCNVGANTPEDSGDYFAWGETTPKKVYSLDNYRMYYGGEFTKYFRYVRIFHKDRTDGKMVLDLADDAAHVNWGGSWRMPTIAEIKELQENCTWIWTKKNGVKGYKVTSKTNGNSIFLPVAGYLHGTSVYCVGSKGYYWSSSLNEVFPKEAYYLNFNSGNVDWYSDGNRSRGRTVRAVCP